MGQSSCRKYQEIKEFQEEKKVEQPREEKVEQPREENTNRLSWRKFKQTINNVVQQFLIEHETMDIKQTITEKVEGLHDKPDRILFVLRRGYVKKVILLESDRPLEIWLKFIKVGNDLFHFQIRNSYNVEQILKFLKQPVPEDNWIDWVYPLEQIYQVTRFNNDIPEEVALISLKENTHLTATCSAIWLYQVENEVYYLLHFNKIEVD